MANKPVLMTNRRSPFKIGMGRTSRGLETVRRKDRGKLGQNNMWHLSDQQRRKGHYVKIRHR